MAITFMDGNEALARGAVKAGCTFFAGYPITPATTIFNHMLDFLPPTGGFCIQGEDEIASMGYCMGAAMAGAKAMTATSGPGISLCSEQIAFAVASEIPMVIVDVQRLGPSTGSATRGADGDIQLLRWVGNSSGIPTIVLAPVDVQDCYHMAFHAFNFSEKFRCPVFIASNKEVALTKETIELDMTSVPMIENRQQPTSEVFLPFGAEDDKAPPFLPIGGKIPVRQTSSTHGPDGYITVDPEVIDQSQKRLINKIISKTDEITLFKQNLKKDSDILIISYGVTSRAVDAAISMLSTRRISVSSLTLKTLWPVPEPLIMKTAAQFKHIIVIEMNMGQYVNEIQRVLGDRKIKFLGQMNGLLIQPSQIMEVVTNDILSK